MFQYHLSDSVLLCDTCKYQFYGLDPYFTMIILYGRHVMREVGLRPDCKPQNVFKNCFINGDNVKQ